MAQETTSTFMIEHEGDGAFRLYCSRDMEWKSYVSGTRLSILTPVQLNQITVKMPDGWEERHGLTTMGILREEGSRLCIDYLKPSNQSGNR